MIYYSLQGGNVLRLFCLGRRHIQRSGAVEAGRKTHYHGDIGSYSGDIGNYSCNSESSLFVFDRTFSANPRDIDYLCIPAASVPMEKLQAYLVRRNPVPIFQEKRELSFGRLSF